MIKRYLACALLCCLLSVGAFAQGAGPQSFTFTANSQCFAINTDPKSTSGVYIDVSGTFSLTLQPEVSVAGSSYKNVAVTPTTSQIQQSTITSTGGYNAAVAGPDKFEVCTTGYVSGSAVVVLSPTTGVASNAIGGGGGGGGGDSVTSPNSTITVGGTSAATTIDLNLGNANTWTATQSFPSNTITNAELAHSSLTFTCSAPLNCTSSVSLGGTMTGSVSSATTGALGVVELATDLKNRKNKNPIS